MSLVADITCCQNQIVADLPLKREHEVIDVGNAIPIVVEGVCRNRREVRPVHIVVRIRNGYVVRWKRKRESLAVVYSRCGSDKRRRK
jgi:hypothetical protein